MAPMKVNFNIMNETPHVENQGREGNCYAMAVSDMVGTIYRMEAKKNGHGNIKLTLSPQPLVDFGCLDDAFNILMNANQGLQTVEAYPFTRFRSGDGVRYNNRAKRYNVKFGQVHHLTAEQNEAMIAQNFSPRGKHWPMVASIKMGPLSEDQVAKDAWFMPAFHHEINNRVYMDNLEEEPSHAVLVVGINNTSKQKKKQHCMIKNTYGVEWGHRGFSKIGFELIDELHVVHEI